MSGLAWNARAYEDVAAPQFEWGRALLARRAWRGDEHVLDAGCGPGRLAVEILARLPRGRLTCIDIDRGMVQAARRRLAGEGRTSVHAADLAHYRDGGPFDLVFSNAVLHWVPDHASLFRRFHAMLRPGGELLAQCGGEENLAELVRMADRVASEPAFASAFGGWSPPWHFEGVAATRARLEDAGFVDVEVERATVAVPFEDRNAFLAFAAAAPLVPYLSALGDAIRGRAFTEAVASRYEREDRPWSLDYVRLTLRARSEVQRSPRSIRGHTQR